MGVGHLDAVVVVVHPDARGRKNGQLGQLHRKVTVVGIKQKEAHSDDEEASRYVSAVGSG